MEMHVLLGKLVLLVNIELWLFNMKAQSVYVIHVDINSFCWIK